VTIVPAEKGPPHIGPTGWLFHLDAPNVIATSLRPVPRGVVAQLLEVTSFGGSAELRCVRDPVRAGVLDGDGDAYNSLTVQGDAVQLDISAGDLQQVRIELDAE
jgi:hypothetical protein